jgi:hypothetical protein
VRLSALAESEITNLLDTKGCHGTAPDILTCIPINILGEVS